MDTKELILEKTLKLMIEKQNSIVSIREIQDATGIGTGGIYYYFSSKDELYNGLIERYVINYAKFNYDKFRQINGNAKEKIYKVIAEVFMQNQTEIKIESIDDKVDYRVILEVLTPNICNHEYVLSFYSDFLNEFKKFLTQIIEEGQKNREIRQDLSSADIAESLIIIYMGIHYQWEVYLIDDMISVFEDNFDLEWEKIKFREY